MPFKPEFDSFAHTLLLQSCMHCASSYMVASVRGIKYSEHEALHAAINQHCRVLVAEVDRVDALLKLLNVWDLAL